MPISVRVARVDELDVIVDLLMQNARLRQSQNAALWGLSEHAQENVARDVRAIITAPDNPLRQKFMVAQCKGAIVGVIHGMKLPVPPIYAGKWGDPGLMLSDYFVAPDAPDGTISQLIAAAEDDLRRGGASLLIAACVPGDAWQSKLDQLGYAPLTLYLAKTGFSAEADQPNVRRASDSDIENIVGLSAKNRVVLGDLDVFWEPHEDADTRFGNWMKRSLTLDDRDMLVSCTSDGLSGYLIAQPASRLHFPSAHAVQAIGVIDDYFHADYADYAHVKDGGESAAALLQRGESAFKKRGIDTAMIVCPAVWQSKISVLEESGYQTELIWMIKRP